MARARGLLWFVVAGCTAAPPTASTLSGGDTDAGETRTDDASSSGGVGEAGTDAPDATGSSTGEPTQASESDGACGPSAACGTASHDGRGRAGAVPYGCGDGAFTLRWAWESAGLDASKGIPMAADLDADGTLDIYLSARKTDGLFFAGQGDGTFAEAAAPVAATFLGGWSLDAGDVDADGLLDVVIGDHNHGALAWFGSAGGSYAPTVQGLPQGTFSGVGLADLDGDGLLDALFGADQFGSGIAVALGQTGGWAASAGAGLPGYQAKSNAAPTNVGTFGFPDYDGDGDLDVVAYGQALDGSFSGYVYRNDGGVTFAPDGVLAGPYIGSVGGPTQGHVGDVQCNGWEDVAVGGSIYMGSAGGFDPAALAGPAVVAHFADFDGDGQLEVATHSESAGLQVLAHDGSSWVARDWGLPDAAYRPPEHDAEADLVPLEVAYGIEVDDFDGDGGLEVVRWYRMSLPMPFPAEAQTFHRLEVWSHPG